MKLTNNQLNNSPINQNFGVLSCKSCQKQSLQLSRELYKSNLFMQNEPNFEPKLASFSPNLALFDNEIFAFANNFRLFTNSLINQLTNINLFVSNSASGQAELFPINLFWHFGLLIPIVCIYYKRCAGSAYPHKRNLPKVRFHLNKFEFLSINFFYQNKWLKCYRNVIYSLNS